MNTFVVAKMVVLNDENEMLVLYRSKTDTRRPGDLDFPGGIVNENEDIMAAALRETAEETGLEISKANLVFALSEVEDYGSGTWTVFLARVKGRPSVVISPEHDGFEWITISQAIQKITYERQKRMLKYVYDNHLLDN